MTAKPLWILVKETFSAFNEDKVLRLSAAFAYYAVFSLAPFLIIVMAVAGLFFKGEAVRGEISGQLTGFIGPDAARTVETMVAAQQKNSGVVATVIGVFVLFFGATGLVGQLQDSLNSIWRVRAGPGKGLWHLVRDRVLSLAMVLGVAFLLLISMVISAALHAISGRLGNFLPSNETVLLVGNQAAGFVVAALLFGMIFKLLPLVVIRWHEVVTGSFLTAVLFTAGKFLISYYLGRKGTTSGYGAAGSFVAVLLWVYYSSIILFLGAEFTRIHALRNGGLFKAKKGGELLETPHSPGVVHDSL